MRTLQRGKQPTKLARAFQELGRVIKTLFLLNYLNDESYRRRILTQLNRGEGRHRLARAKASRRSAITAGASAPRGLVEEVIDAFRDRYDVTVELVETAKEDVEFKVPPCPARSRLKGRMSGYVSFEARILPMTWGDKVYTIVSLPEAVVAAACATRRVEGEFDDVGLMRVFGLRGQGLFPVRAAMAAEAEDIGGVVSLGPIPGVTERYFAISVERRVRHLRSTHSSSQRGGSSAPMPRPTQLQGLPARADADERPATCRPRRSPSRPNRRRTRIRRNPRWRRGRDEKIRWTPPCRA
ncbi:MAG: Tn3 family transposase [Myxococcales bacterium]|nr:Tn3 family transposase [Myxococcales bacterium]